MATGKWTAPPSNFPNAWPYIYQSRGNTPDKVGILIENDAASLPVTVVYRIVPAAKGTEEYLPSVLMPGTSVLISSVYSIRVAVDASNDANAKSGYGQFTVIPLVVVAQPMSGFQSDAEIAKPRKKAKTQAPRARLSSTPRTRR